MSAFHRLGLFGEINSYHHRSLRRIAAVTSKNPSVVDVGAHIGGWTYLARRILGQGDYFMIDPINLWESTLRRYFLKFAKYLEVAVSDFDGHATFYLDNRLDSSSLIARPNSKERRIEVFRLDTLISKGLIAPPTVLKIDAEGKDLEVLRSLGSYTEYLEVCVIEIPLLRSRADESVSSLNNWMDEHGFETLGVWPAAFWGSKYVQLDYVLVRTSMLDQNY